jgi:copper resistance protein B
MSPRRPATVRLLAKTAFAVAVAFTSPALADMGDAPVNRMIRFEELEYGFNNGDNPLIWFKTDGKMATSDPEVHGDAQLLYSRLIAPFWELQFGLRGDLAAAEHESTRGRGLLVLGLEGLAPYWFEVEPAIFVSHEGDVSARLRATYDLFITQRLIAHPSFKMNVAIQSAPEFGVGSGFNDIELGLRLGYQVARELTPYVGISWNQAFSETARFRRAAGNAASDLQGVAGLRLWF